MKAQALSTLNVRNEKKKKKAVQISSSSFLGKEHEMSYAGVST